MNAKSTLKMALDRLMVVLLPLLMAYSLIGDCLLYTSDAADEL